jgi:glycolate oxidase iron-sulfur subunit
MTEASASGNQFLPFANLLSDCVHCGFCLSSCPTYAVLAEEMDSPRGRIELMRQALEDEPLSDSVAVHLDRCLGCMACVPACPSGVQYDTLIDAARRELERRHTRSVRERLTRALIFAVFPHRRRAAALRGPLWLYQRSGAQAAVRRHHLLRRLPPTLQALEAIAPPVSRRENLPAFVAAGSPRRAVVGMLTGCVQHTFFSGVNAATARVLAAEGCDVHIPRRQGCCGALSAHSGRPDEASRFARALIDAFDEARVDAIIVNSAGCGSVMKDYARLLRDDPAYAARAAAFADCTRDVAEFLDRLGPAAPRHPLPVTVAYHDACHLSNAQRITAEPRRLLSAIPGLRLREIPDSHLCCGSAGIYNLLQPEIASELGTRKADNIRRTGAALVVAANPGCLMQISRTMCDQSTAGIAHTIEVLDASIRGLPAESLGAAPRPLERES